MSTMAPRLSPSQMPSPEDYAALLRSMENGSANDNDSWTWWNTVSWISYCGSIPFRIIRQALSMTYSWEMTRSNAPSLKDRVTLESIDIESEGMRFTLLDEAPESAPSTGSWGGIAGTLISAPITTLRDWMFGRLPDWHERQHGLGLGAICEAVRAKIEPGSFIDPSRLSHFQNATRMAADRLLSPLYKSHWDKHESFIFHLRQACLLSAEEEPGKISEEASLLKAMIYGRFLHNHIHSFCTELLRLFRDHTLTSVAQQYGLTVTKESQKKLPLIQRLWLFFLIVKHADAELKGSPLQRIYDSFCGEFNYYFDPHKWGNIPHRLYTLVYQQPEGSEKRIPNIRMGTPTQQVDSSVPNAASTSVIPEFRQFLEFCRQEGKLHVYFNFQRLWATAVHGDESQRCNAIMQLEEEFPEAFAFISLSKDSAFYHQKDGFENSIPTD
ncbi:MAG: hypothetical protein KDK78_04450, partial [Chlamydiia bacterium]|nr:hypothetical protein [Chlamydiia bacterium]